MTKRKHDGRWHPNRKYGPRMEYLIKLEIPMWELIEENRGDMSKLQFITEAIKSYLPQEDENNS
tara:strand:+ start:1718 stop:1909 length:192 start_codon:yes stop_codon:yes gene_type:complete